MRRIAFGINHQKAVRMLKKRVFVIDDETDLLELFKECLESESNEIITFDNHIDAINASKQNKPDLIIIDANLKGVSGIDVIHLFDQDIPKHLCSGNNFKEVPKGFTSVLPKPFSMEEMMKLVS